MSIYFLLLPITVIPKKAVCSSAFTQVSSYYTSLCILTNLPEGRTTIHVIPAFPMYVIPAQAGIFLVLWHGQSCP